MWQINKLFYKKKIIILLLGPVIGIWGFFSPGTLCVTILTIALLYIFSFNFKELSQQKNIITICILAISLRFLLATFFYYFSYNIGKGADFFGDARAYSVSGQYIAEVATHKPMQDIDGNEPGLLEFYREQYKGEIPFLEYRLDGFPKFAGLLYSMFGYAPITVKFLNSFFSLFTAILLFLLVKDMFSIKVANIVLVLGLFWPSLFLWSVTTLKDTLTIFLITLGIFIFVNLKKYLTALEILLAVAILIVTNYLICLLTLICILLIRIYKKVVFKRKIYRGILMPLALILIMKITYGLLYQVRFHWAVTLLFVFLFSIITFLNKRKLVFLFMLLLCLSLFLPIYLTQQHIDIQKYFTTFIKKTIIIHRGQSLASSGYRIYPARFYETDSNGKPDPIIKINPFELTISYFRGLAYTFFSPFPFLISNNAMYFLVSPQMIIYYILLPFIIVGFFIAFRYKWHYALPMTIFIVSSASLHALSEGNMGTLFRHRESFMFFLLIFAAIGIGKFLGYIKIDRVA